MSKIKKILTPRVTMGLFVLALILLLMSSVSGTRAALSYVSDDYTAEMELQEIGVALLENGKQVSGQARGLSDSTVVTGDPLLTQIPGEGQKFILNKAYDEKLSVQNLGEINEYVRVTVYRYWADAEGNKRTDLNPAFIGLDFKDGENGWVIDKNSQTLLYHTGVLGHGDVTDPFVEHLTVDDEINNVYTRTEDEEGNIVYTYDYDGAYVCVKAVVDAVQDHNAEAAMKSAWGVDMADVLS